MRSLTTRQTDALAAPDRTTFVRVKVEDPDAVMVDVTDLYGQDFFDQLTIQADVDNPISVATVVLFRKSGPYSIAPLDEDSVINRDSGGTYAPFLNPGRDISVEVATLPQGAEPESGDWVLIWEGIVDSVDWGGRGSKVVLRCRDPMSRLNDTFIETVSAYGNDSGTKDVEDVMQDILTAEISSPSVTLVYSATSFVVYEYDLGNVSVLDALLALRDLIGWNLTWKWDTGGGDLALVLWEPARSNTTADYTFDSDDYFVLPRVALDQEGIRNKGEVVYITTAGTVASATDTRTSSVTLYSTRFIRIDARGTSVVTATQASDLLSGVLDDLEEPSVQQEVELPFFWPVELGDLYAFSANDHYSTEQKWGVFGYRHILSQQGPRRTILTVSGKPSGGYERWHNKERGRSSLANPPSLEVTFAADGDAVVSATGNEATSNIYVTVGDGSAPNDPTPSSNNGSITGRSGTVDTAVKITTGRIAYVKAIAIDYDGRASAVSSAQHARRIGVIHRDTSTRNHSGSTGQEELESISVAAGAGIGDNETWRLEVYGAVSGTTGTKSLIIAINGSPGNQNLLTFTIPASYEGDFYLVAGIAGNNSSNAQNTKGRLILNSANPLLHKSATTIQSGAGFSIDVDMNITSGDSASVTRTELVAEGTS